MGKEYVSKKGRRFSISALPKPAQEDVVFFTPNIFEWCKQQNLDADAFEMIWLLIREDFRYDPIPEEEVKKSETLAEIYGSTILKKLKGLS